MYTIHVGKYHIIHIPPHTHTLQEAQWAQHVACTGGATGPRAWPGATALVVLVLGDALWCANAGDCRAVLCRDGKVCLCCLVCFLGVHWQRYCIIVLYYWTTVCCV